MYDGIIILLIMLFAGIFGGIVSYYKSYTETTSPQNFLSCILLSVSASLLVPLFLQVISSNLISDILEPGKHDKKILNYFLLGGFCLLASLASKRFISTISEKILKDVEKAKIDASDAKDLAEKTNDEIKETSNSVKKVKEVIASKNPIKTSKELKNQSSFKAGQPPIDDPQKGRWGGKPEVKDRLLEAIVKSIDKDNDWFDITLIVRSINPSNLLTGSVIFHLHDTFKPQEREILVKDGKAILKLIAWGAFTVGAVADGGDTKLELDLSELKDAPKEFRER